MNNDILWSKVLEDIRPKVNEMVYQTWFKPLKLYKIEKNMATIIVPQKIHQKHIEETYSDFIKSALAQVTSNVYDFELILEDDIPKEQEQISFINNIVDKTNTHQI